MRSSVSRDFDRDYEEAKPLSRANSGRKAAFAATLLAGLVLAVLGFILSAPIGPASGPAISDPQVTGAPIMFVLGVVLIFVSPAVYELYPGQDE
jgi:uncharacterized RDD family membrane protein YckC